MPDRRVEGPQVEGVEVDEPAQRRVGGVQHLEAAVEGVAVDVVGAHPAAHRVPRLEDAYVETAAGQGTGAGETGQPGPDHDDVGGREAHGRLRWA